MLAFRIFVLALLYNAIDYSYIHCWFYLIAGPCFVCDKQGVKLCTDCNQLEYLRSDITPYFCEECSLLWHSHPQRQSHKPVARSGTPDTYPLELLSVLCIETSHYVCFTRITGSGKNQWVFFDSMATRTGNNSYFIAMLGRKELMFRDHICRRMGEITGLLHCFTNLKYAFLIMHVHSMTNIS